ncbi:hypothetical protein APHAL10511_002089 [Amanita phalloides]|nr:hypothetical protein APHAL10511_002089 [Amanita phalloides]
MPLGEEPITSYFPRLAPRKPVQLNSSTKPRLREVDATPAHDSSSNRKRVRALSERSSSSGTPPPVWDLLSKTPKSKKTRHVTSSVISLDDDSDDDLTSLRSGVVPSTNSTLTSESGNTKSGIRMKTDLHVKERQRLHVKPHVPNAKWHPSRGTPKRPDRLIPTLEDLDNETTQRDVEILSSQVTERLDQVLLRPSKDPMQSSQRSTPEGDCQHNSEFTPQSSDTISITDNCSKHPNRPSVESSQTQNILLDYVSPRRPRIRKRPPVISVTNYSGNEDNDNVVQSSQTQCEVDLQGVHWRLDGPRSRQPFRTLSDVLFSVPRRGASTNHLVDDLPLQQCSGLDAMKELEPESQDMAVQEDSVTESDSDGEMLKLWANNTCAQDPHSQSYTADQTQTSVASDDIGSFPAAVKNFQEMFDGDDFPTW